MFETVFGMTASGMTTMKFFAPPRACTRLPLAAARSYTYWATLAEPTNEIASTPLVVEQGVHDVDGAVHEVQHAVGQAAVVVDHVEDELLRQRHLLGRLQDERVAAGDRERQEPERHHRREVERHDGGADAHRLADRLAVDVAGDVLEDAALHRLGDGGRRLDHLDHAADLGARVGQGLAHLAGDRPGQLVGVGVDHLAQAEQPAGALDHGPGAPLGQRRPGGLDGRVDVGRARQGHAGEDLSGGGVSDVALLAGGRGHPAAPDVVSEQTCVSGGSHLGIESEVRPRRHLTLCP